MSAIRRKFGIEQGKREVRQQEIGQGPTAKTMW